MGEYSTKLWFGQSHQVCLEVEVAGDLPTLEIDRTRIWQVLLNLLNNAQRFAEGGVSTCTAVG
jgi:signal transduction histidine kinase